MFKPRNCRPRVFTATVLAILSLGAPVASARQEKSAGTRLAPPVVKVWEFGMKVTSSSPSTGITATVPIPNDWPEQKVEILEEIKSDLVARISIKKLPQNARQMVFRINRLGAGESATAKIRMKITKHSQTSPSDPSLLKIADKVPGKYRQYLRPSPFIESNHKRIKQIAASIARPDGLSDFEYVETIYVWVRDNVEYEFDTTIRTCLEAIDQGKGDCEELSSLFIAICRAKRIPARAVWIPAHTYPEFLMFDAEDNPHWIPCQVAGGYEFGAMTEDRPILQKGDKFSIAGEPRPVRYVKPTLVAKDSAGGLGIQWIMNEVDGDGDADADGTEPSQPPKRSGGLFGKGKGKGKGSGK